ncbi:MAG TPA: DUF4157 domain-containing protein [Pyrinomonadaceae bacterium]|nr:DUF4157 domain-containing protein [Pyrinomonadaceae bacterium]
MNGEFEQQPKASFSQTPTVSRVLQRKCACGQHAAGGECESCKKERESGTLQRTTGNSQRETRSSSDVPRVVHEVLHSPSQSLDQETRAFFESRFDHDFSGVRIHADSRAAESAEAVDAVAYTAGRDLVFARGQYEPHTTSGRRLLAHELTHVAQQRGALSSGALTIGAADSPHEHEAESAVAAIENNQSPAISGETSAVQRQPAKKITAAVPKEATINKEGQASFQINGVDVIAEPDRTVNDKAMNGRAETNFGLVLDTEAGGQYDDRTHTITSVTPPQIHATVITTFGPGYDPKKTASYGRGTTPADKRAGTTNLGFHESRHGADWFDYLKQNAPPAFGGKAGTSLDDFVKAREQFHKDIDAYNRRAQDYTKRNTDCVGVLPKAPKERELATFCKQQQP